MRYFFQFLLLVFSLHSFAQTQVICPGDTDTKRYWVDKIEGATYQWRITSGSGLILGGANFSTVRIKWFSRTPATLLVTAEKENACIAERVLSIVFNGPTAKLLPLATTTYCDPPALATASVELTGSAPWSLSYTVNGQVYTQENISTPRYELQLPAMSHGKQYDISLTQVENQQCTGSVSGGVQTIKIAPELSPLQIFY